jgi:selenocysteine lyase/cysteine desulfurase
MAGMSAAMHYLATAGESPAPALPAIDACDDAAAASLRIALAASMRRIRDYEMGLASRLLDAVGSARGVTILGDPDPAHAASRVPTVSFAVAGKTPAGVVDHLASRGIQARDGHMYAPRLLRAAGFDPDEGVARVSLCHYNTDEEIARLAQALRAL